MCENSRVIAYIQLCLVMSVMWYTDERSILYEYEICNYAYLQQ